MSKISQRTIVFKTTQPRFKRVVVIDDNSVDLFINKAIIDSVKMTKEIKYELKARFVMEQLKNTERLSEVPELIFIDLKMDDMDGFSFLKEFNRLSDFVRNKCKIVVVTSSENQLDKYLALMNPNVIRFLLKPLDACQLRDFLYF